MKKRLNRSTKQYIIVSLICVFIIGGAFICLYFTVLKNIKSNYKEEIQVLVNQLKTKEVYVYEAKDTIPAGTRITRDRLDYIKAYSDQAQTYFMSEADIGKVTLIKLDSGTHILKSMLTQDCIDSNVREVEFNVFSINSNLKDNDFVDIRIMFPNGEDYIVLSKKSIKSLTLESSNCFLWLSEEEILNMSGAIVDAYLYSGTRLYTTKYIEPSLQDPSITTYQPSLSILKLMEQDENIVDKASKELNKRLRKEMENRFAIYENLDITQVEWYVSEEVKQKEYDRRDDVVIENDKTEEVDKVEKTGVPVRDDRFNEYGSSTKNDITTRNVATTESNIPKAVAENEIPSVRDLLSENTLLDKNRLSEEYFILENTQSEVLIEYGE